MRTDHLAAAPFDGHSGVAVDPQGASMRPASLPSRLPRMLLVGAGVVAGLGLYAWGLSARTVGEPAFLALAAVGTLLLAVAGLLAAFAVSLRAHGWPTLARRAVARLVDLGLAAVVGLLIALGIAPLLTDDPAEASEVRLVVFLFGVPLLAGLYEVVLVALGGQTVGKMAARVRVQRLDGTPPGWEASTLRAAPLLLAPLLLAAPVFVGPPLLLLVYLWAVGARDQRGIHDHLAGTRVIPA
jgi:uncharacterized RDD family membrane protein YckC